MEKQVPRRKRQGRERKKTAHAWNQAGGVFLRCSAGIHRGRVAGWRAERGCAANARNARRRTGHVSALLYQEAVSRSAPGILASTRMRKSRFRLARAGKRGMPPEPESKFYNLAQARIADGLHCPSSSPVSSVVPHHAWQSKALCLTSAKWTWNFWRNSETKSWPAVARAAWANPRKSQLDSFAAGKNIAQSRFWSRANSLIARS